MILPTPTIEIPGWPENWLAGPAVCANALACFDTLAGLEPEFMIGRWRGASLPTGHSLDGVLEALGWYGKAFQSVDRVHPLLFRTRSGAVIPLDPTFMPTSIALRWPALAKSTPVRVAFAAGRPLLRSDDSAARLRAVNFRGKRSAAMTYDRKSIADHFRRIDDNRVLGLMEMRVWSGHSSFCLPATEARSPDEDWSGA